MGLLARRRSPDHSGGLYNLAFAFFVGFSGLYQTVKAWTLDPGIPLFTAVAICYFVQVVTWLLFWSGGVSHRLPTNAGQADGRTAGWAVKSGLLLLVLAVAMAAIAPDSMPVANPGLAPFVGVVLLAVGPSRVVAAHHRFLVVALLIAFAVYFTPYLFTGFGRIVVGTLALGSTSAMSAHRDQRPYTKLLILGWGNPASVCFLAGLRATASQGSPVSLPRPGWNSRVGDQSRFARSPSSFVWMRLGWLPRGWGIRSPTRRSVSCPAPRGKANRSASAPTSSRSWSPELVRY